MSQPLRILPEEMQQAAGALHSSSQEIGGIRHYLQREWNRLDSGWEWYARVDANRYYRTAMRHLAQMEQVLEQIAEAIARTANLLDAADKQSETFFVKQIQEAKSTASVVETSEDEFDLIEWIKSIKIPWWLEMGISVIPFGDLYDIIKELVIDQLKGENIDALVLSLAIFGLIADLGWLAPTPGAEDVPNVALATLKTIAKNVPPGPARDAIAEIIEQAVKNPDDLKRLGEVSAQLVKNSEVFEVLLKNPDVLKVVLKNGPETVEFAAKYGDDAIYVMTKYGDDAVEILHGYNKIADVPGADRLMKDLVSGGTTAQGAIGEIKYAASLGDDVVRVGDVIDGRKAADIVLNDGTIVDVKNWNFDSAWYADKNNIDNKIVELVDQVNLRKKQYDTDSIEYVFLCPKEKIPNSIIEALEELGVVVKGVDL